MKCSTPGTGELVFHQVPGRRKCRCNVRPSSFPLRFSPQTVDLRGKLLGRTFGVLTEVEGRVPGGVDILSDPLRQIIN